MYHPYEGKVLQAMLRCSIPGCKNVIRCLVALPSFHGAAMGFLCYDCKIKLQKDDLVERGILCDEANRDE